LHQIEAVKLEKAKLDPELTKISLYFINKALERQIAFWWESCYTPTKGILNPLNPPKGGSGVPKCK